MQIITSWQRCGIALLSTAMLYAGSPVGVGYLPRMGPTPLRFQSSFHRDPSSVLPPLDMGLPGTNAPVDLPLPSADEHAPDVQPPEIDLLNPWPDLPLPESNGMATNSPPAGMTGATVPQLLMQYFARTTNQPLIISVPVEFNPPPPPLNQNRSSAVYISK